MRNLYHSMDDIKNGIMQKLNDYDIVFTDEILDNHNITSFIRNDRKIYITQFKYFFEGFEFEYVITLHKLDKNIQQEYIDLNINVALDRCVESVIELLNNKYKEFE